MNFLETGRNCFYWSQSLVKTMRFERKTLVATHLLNLQNE
jgi:hypothetical protein